MAARRGSSVRPRLATIGSLLTPHVCPACQERVPENQRVVVLRYTGGRRGRTQGYHRACYHRAS